MSANLAKDDLGTWKVEKKTILLVDDSTRLLNLVSKTLEKSFDIIAVDEPSDALQMAENFKPDLVLLDIHLPNVDGFDLLKRMSEHPITTDVPIVMMSGDDNIELKKTAYDRGASGFITKPFDYKTLSNTIYSILDGLNNIIENDDTNRSFHTYFNSKMKNQSIKNLVLQNYLEEEKVILISWLPAEKVMDDFMQEMIDEEKLVFLQFKSSLIVKFPYLQDLSIVVDEIEHLTGDNEIREYHLLVDEPRNLMNLYKSESALSQAMAFSNNLYSKFRTITFLNTKLSDPSYTINLQKLGRVLLGY